MEKLILYIMSGKTLLKDAKKEATVFNFDFTDVVKLLGAPVVTPHSYCPLSASLTVHSLHALEATSANELHKIINVLNNSLTVVWDEIP